MCCHLLSTLVRRLSWGNDLSVAIRVISVFHVAHLVNENEGNQVTNSQLIVSDI